jgi:hypothetical protein
MVLVVAVVAVMAHLQEELFQQHQEQQILAAAVAVRDITHQQL